MGIKSFISIAVLMVLLSACSVSRWTVEEEAARDENDFRVVDTRYFLQSTNHLTPEQPVVYFDLMAAQTFEYAQRIRTERYVQQYKPRLGYVLLGAAGAGLSYYAAFSDQLLTRPTDGQKYALTGAGTLLTGLSFLNMKPSGKPKKTGESRLLRKTGTELEIDTTTATPYSDQNVTVRISYQGELLSENESRVFEGHRLPVNVAEEVDASVFEENPDQPIVIETRYDSLQSRKEVSVSSVFEQYVVVDAQLTPLRNAPESNPNNVLNDLAEGSQLELVEREGDWYKVLYGISETWVAANDVHTIWRSADFGSDLSVITVPNVPFGAVDVEQQIPVLGPGNMDASALIVSNFAYEEGLSERIYGQRDARLIEEYFIQALGIRQSRITKAMNVETDRAMGRAYARLADNMSDSVEVLTVYISGYSMLSDGEVHLAAPAHSEEEPRLINLHTLFKGLANLRSQKTIVFLDLDFIEASQQSVLQQLAEIITSKNPQSAVIFGASGDQRSGIYSEVDGPQKRHSIFTYFLADALKNRYLGMENMMNHLDRNVSFTSRSLYDRPQTPLFFGNRQLQIID